VPFWRGRPRLRALAGGIAVVAALLILGEIAFLVHAALAPRAALIVG
jgi:hypothetical protein